MEVINLTLISLIGSINLREKKTATTTKKQTEKKFKKTFGVERAFADSEDTTTDFEK